MVSGRARCALGRVQKIRHHSLARRAHRPRAPGSLAHPSLPADCEPGELRLFDHIVRVPSWRIHLSSDFGLHGRLRAQSLRYEGAALRGVTALAWSWRSFFPARVVERKAKQTPSDCHTWKGCFARELRWVPRCDTNRPQLLPPPTSPCRTQPAAKNRSSLRCARVLASRSRGDLPPLALPHDRAGDGLPRAYK
jgi:hypothetical protein